MRRRGVVFIGATAMAAAVLFSVFHDKLDTVSSRSGRAAIPEYHDASKPVETAVGREFMIVLEADKATGFRWQLDASLDKTLLQVVEIKRSAAKTKQGARQVKDLWTFKGLREGEITVPFGSAGSVGETPRAKMIFTVIIKK